jgi:hypothetical protein
MVRMLSQEIILALQVGWESLVGQGETECIQINQVELVPSCRGVPRPIDMIDQIGLVGMTDQICRVGHQCRQT